MSGSPRSPQRALQSRQYAHIASQWWYLCDAAPACFAAINAYFPQLQLSTMPFSSDAKRCCLEKHAHCTDVRAAR